MNRLRIGGPSSFWSQAATTALLLVFFIGPVRLAVELGEPGWRARARKIYQTLRNRDLNPEDRAANTAGYYENIMNHSARVTNANQLFTRAWIPARLAGKGDFIGQRARADFLTTENIPNLNLKHRRYGLITTNSYGMADKEYPLGKPANARRIALIGDSILQGWGVPIQESFQALLEEKLNAEAGSASRKFELLNFGVGGYRITQNLEVMTSITPRFQPDAYVVTLTYLSVFRHWGMHLWEAARSGVDLKYDFIRTLAAKSRLSSQDTFAAASAKLEQFRIPTIAWVLRQMKAHCDRTGVPMLIVLLPSLHRKADIEQAFRDVIPIMSELGSPVLDLLSVLHRAQNPEQLRVAPDDEHPSREGHRIIFESLYSGLRDNPEAWAMITGDSRSDGSQMVQSRGPSGD